MCGKVRFVIAQDTDMTYERFYLLSEMCGFYVCFICYLLILFYSFDYIPEYDFFRPVKLLLVTISLFLNMISFL